MSQDVIKHFFYLYGNAQFANGETTQIISLVKGWNLIGVSASISVEGYANVSGAAVIKDFNRFWEKNRTLNSISESEVGKAYFVKK